MLALAASCSNLRIASISNLQQLRTLWKIPPWHYNIRFNVQEGRKVPSQSALNRFKRLNNGMWIKGKIGRGIRMYENDADWLKDAHSHYTCSKEETIMLDKLMTPYWLRPKYYLDDPYEAYHTRKGLNVPRVDYKGRLTRERPKILLEDSVADKYFNER